nr:MAG TPA: hypothetical protein [Caudoviricetes sp.]
MTYHTSNGVLFCFFIIESNSTFKTTKIRCSLPPPKWVKDITTL